MANGGDSGFAKLEKLGELKAKGVITDKEFDERKATLLAEV